MEWLITTSFVASWWLMFCYIAAQGMLMFLQRFGIVLFDKKDADSA